MADAILIDQITDLQRASSLEPEWNALWERCPQATPFQAADWQLASWRHLAPLKRRLLFTACIRGELVALLLVRDRGDGGIEFEGDETCDYLDVLIAPEWRARALCPLLEALDESLGRHTCLKFERLPSGSALLQEQIPRGWQSRLEDHDVCPYVALNANAGRLQDVLPTGFFKQVERARRVAARHCTIEVTVATASDAQAHLDGLFRLHKSRWLTRTEPGVFVEPAVQHFHRSALPPLIALGRAWLLELRLNGVAAAALEVLCGHRRALLYAAGFSPQFAHFSPGRLLLAELFERVLREDYLEVDFLRGVEAYKYDWGAQNRSTRRVHIVPRSSQWYTEQGQRVDAHH